jgi:hypothetical protein
LPPKASLFSCKVPAWPLARSAKDQTARPFSATPRLLKIKQETDYPSTLTNSHSPNEKVAVISSCSLTGKAAKNPEARVERGRSARSEICVRKDAHMKRMLRVSSAFYSAVVASALLTGAALHATPYATSVTNDAGVVSFRLNQTTSTNDTVLVISGNGTVTNVLQAPSADPASVLTRGLIQTNLGIAPGPIKIYIKHIGSGVISTNTPRIEFNSLRGLAVNTRPASPYFGWVYVGNSAAGTHGDGMFAFTSDLSDALGQGTTAKSGGYDFGGTASAPYHVSVAPDDSVLVTDWSDVHGNVIAMDPLLDTFTYVLKQFEGTAASPVGATNNHGSISHAVIVGSGANRVLYTMDEDYQTDPTTGVATEWNSVWRYDIGDAPLPWTNPPNRKIMSPYLTTFAGQNQKIEVVGRYLYANQRRSNPPQHSAYIVDLQNLMDPSTFAGATPWGMHWTSQQASLDAGYSDDILRDTMAIAVSPDGKWFAAIIAAGSNSAIPIVQPDGSTFVNVANEILVAPLTNGIPNLAAAQRFRPGGVASGRDLAFDAAHNIVFGMTTKSTAPTILAMQSLDIGESAEAITGSDGTFSLVTPATQVSVTAATSLALEQGSVPGVFTITRTPEDIGNPMTVIYTLTGSATNAVDFGAITNQVTMAAGQTNAEVTVTPIDDASAELNETVVLTIKSGGEYSVGFPVSATVNIVDNETPQLRIVSLSTNIYQGYPNDYATLRLRRYGQTNAEVTLNVSDFALGGTAVSNVDYYLTNLPLTIAAGTVDATVNLIYPRDASTNAGSKSIIVTNLAGAGYTVSNHTATTWLTLKAPPTGPVLFSEDFEGDAVAAGAKWDTFFAAFGDQSPDFNVTFGYDYGAGGLGNLPALPPAPNSAANATHGLYLTVNKADDIAAAAALNLYLKSPTFSGNYALLFDMFLVQNSGGAQQSKNEIALFGINHSGTRTNWIRNAVPGTGAGTNKFESDGIFASVEADASTTLNFALWSGPTWTNGASVVGPTNFIARRSSTLTQVFKKPPFDAGPTAGGVPANTVVNPTPTWVSVEISQVGNTVTWKMNNTVMFSYLNTNANTSLYKEGRIMLGFNDPWDDIANGSAGSGESAVIYDNIRVITLVSAPMLSASLDGSTLNLTFATQSGFSYVVEWKSDLASATWNTLATIPGTGSPVTTPAPTQPDPYRFFRVRLQ